MRAQDQGVAAAISRGDTGLLRKALVLGDLGVNDSLHLQHGHTALHIAASHGHRHVCIFLVQEAGADVLTCDALGRTPIDMALEAGHNDLADEIASYVDNPLEVDIEPLDPSSLHGEYDGDHAYSRSYDDRDEENGLGYYHLQQYPLDNEYAPSPSPSLPRGVNRGGSFLRVDSLYRK